MIKTVKGFENLDYETVESELNTEFGQLENGFNNAKQQRIRDRREYEFQLYGNERAGESTFVDSTIFDIVEWMAPVILQVFVETNDFVSVNPIRATYSSILSSRAIKELLNLQVRRQNKYYTLMYDTIKNFLIEGTSYVKVLWVDKDKKRGIPVSYPKIIAIPAAQIRYDWDVKEFTESSVVTQEEDITRSTLLQMKKHEEVMTEVLDELLEGAGREARTSRLTDEENPDNRVSRGSSPSKMLYLRREHWTQYDLEGNGELEPALAIFINDRLVSLVRNTLPDKAHPFLNAECIRDTNNGRAAGEAELNSDLQQYSTAMMRLMSNNLNSQQNGVYAYDTTKVDDIAMQLFRDAPSGARTIIPTSAADGVTAIQPAPIASQVFPIYELVQTAKENRGGFTRYSQGSDRSSLNQTATGITQIMSRSDLRTWELTMRLAEHFLTPLARKLISYNQANMTAQDIQIVFASREQEFTTATGDTVIIPGREAGEWISLSKEDLKGEFAVEVDVETKEAKRQKVDDQIRWMSTFAPFVGQGIPPEVISAAALNTARLMGLKEFQLIMSQEIANAGPITGAIPPKQQEQSSDVGGAGQRVGVSGGASVPVATVTGGSNVPNVNPTKVPN